jgi:hypothetical protein
MTAVVIFDILKLVMLQVRMTRQYKVFLSGTEIHNPICYERSTNHQHEILEPFDVNDR